MSESFYIGYRTEMDGPLRRFTRRALLVLALLCLAVSLRIALAQRGFSNGVFEWGVEREFRGFVEDFPAPALLVERPGAAAANERFSRFLLVGFGKHGVGDRLNGLAGRRVALSGTLIARSGISMIELADAEPRVLDDDRPPPRPIEEDLGSFALEGEIVDSKCWLGVMKPGEWKPHRACAVRCIAGGVPPIFVVDRENGGSLQFLLVGSSGEAVNARILDLVAEPLAVSGRVVRRGDLLVLHADPESFRRIE
jgi:hypothetical protein